ncbi:pitrilysin family protein [Sphingomonas sp. 28-62-11]|uniref:M16 family metallopeptidase n=1 Tax=Sphingomonas sp. 28-62-11 TaxID=1970432 RepID=UPI000BD234D3|nr:MAG: peptidase M16 [Sphingomonas sp. 28-62-11]
MHFARAALFLSVAALPFTSQAKTTRLPRAATTAVKPIAYTERTLANGLRVYAIRDTGTATVSVQVWYDVGSKDDPKGKSGFAHMFEHLMFKATRNLVPEQFDRLTEDVGGFNNASTNDDYTNYYQTVPANHLQRLLFAEADRMATLVVEPTTFASERDVVKEELRLRVLAQPYGKLFSLYFPEISYTTHPYARPGIGSIADLEAASIDDVRAFHATYYRPDNAVLVVAGNFDPKQLDAWIDQYFAGIKKPDRPIPRVTVTEPERTAAITRTVYEDNTPLPAIIMSYPIPADRHPDSAPLAVLNAILSAGESSRLYESLVYRDQTAQAAGTFLDSKQSTGAFAVYAILAGGKTVEAGEAGLKAEIARIRDKPVSAAELTEAKNQLLTGAISQRETADGKASAIASAVIIDGDPRAADRQLTALAAVTAADVQRVARRYLAENRSATVRYLPATPGGPKGDAIDVAPTVQVAALAAPADIQVFTPATAAERILPPAAGAPIAAAIPTPVETRLANGLRVIVVEKHDLPLISATVVATPGGGAADPADRAGLNNLAAALLTKGTKTRSATDIARQIESLGGSISSDADWDGASVSVAVKSDQALPAMAILADVAMNPAFAQDEIDRARTQAIDGIGVELKDPARLAGFVAARAVFGGSPYGHLLSGTPESLKAVTRADVTNSYAASWRPDRAALVLVGDITLTQARALAAKNFAAWKAPAGAAAAPSVAQQTYPAPRVIVVDFPGAGQAGVVISRVGIARKNADYYPAAVANATLGVGFSSRLNQEIRIKRGLAYGAGSSVAARRQPGPISASTQTKNPSAAEVVSLIVAEMKRLGSEKAPAAELDTRKAVLIGGFGRSAETTGGIANLIGGYVIDDVSLSELQTYAARIQGVDPAAVQAAAAKLLDPTTASIVVVGESKAFIDDLRKAYPGLELIPASALKLDSPTLK